MKRKSREGAGKGPNKANLDSNSKKQKREIKNARGLRDVLGLSEKSGKSDQQGGRSGDRKPSRDENRRGASGFGRHKDEGRFGGRDSDRSQGRSRPVSSSEESSRSKGPASKKLTYIMNFQPPPDAPKEPSRESVREPAKRSAVTSRPTETFKKGEETYKVRRSEPVTEKNRRPQQGRPHEAPPRREEAQTKNEYRWPKDRLKSPVATDAGRAGRGRGVGGAARIQGIVKRHPDGYGFVISEDPAYPDVYVARQELDGIMTNDRVEVEVHQSRKRDGDRDAKRLYGEVTRVISRANTRVVGRYLPVDQKYGVILDDGKGWGADLRIAAKDSMDAKEGDLVAVEITQYPAENKEFKGRVVSLLGNIDEPLNDVKRIIYAQGIPAEFSDRAVADARKFGGKVSEAEMREREDIRDLPLITIDSATARDFDDAVYVEQTRGGFRLVVGIADVSHYVKPGTQLDEEAYERGTSTYFPNYVVPMLPEELSNELCSLKPRVPRLCFACEMQIDYDGEIQDYRFFEAVMESKARVTYGEAQEVIDGNTPQKLKHVEENIRLAADLAKILMNKRFREGSLDLEIPETQVVVDSTGETVDIIKAERLFAHRLIEELMLVTNICTARFLSGAPIPGIFRIHEEPKEENIRALQRYLWNLGGSRSLMGGSLQKKLTKALQSVEGQPGAQILNILTLRTMNQAKYSEENVGHFGLGFSHYSHFTSPIRRYPDLIAHRLIKSQLYPKYHSMAMSEEELAAASVHLSGCEQRSVKAERQVISIKKARFMSQFVGQEFEGLVSSVAKFGIFVLLRQYDVDGLVKIEELGDDRFLFDDENLRLIGQRTGKRFNIGDMVRVVVNGVDPMQGRIDFGLGEGQAAERGVDYDEDELDDERPREQKRGAHKAGKKSRFDVQERRKAKNDRGRVRKERVSKRRRKD